MKRYVITFAGTSIPRNEKDRHFLAYGIYRDYLSEAKRFKKSVEELLFSEGLTFILYDLDWLEKLPEFLANPKTFERPPYHWAFKPLTIWYTLQNADKGDLVLYADSTYMMHRYPSGLFDIATRHGIYTYDHTPTYYPNRCWTYRDTFVKMGCDEQKYWDGPQYHADVLCIQKNDFTMKFIEEWKNYVCDFETIGTNNLENFPCYKDHRDDQSVFSILAIKYGIEAHSNPAYYLWEHPSIDLDARDFKDAPYK